MFDGAIFDPAIFDTGAVPVVVTGGTGGGLGARRRQRDDFGPLLLAMLARNQAQIAAEAAAVAERDRLNKKEREALLAFLRRQMALQFQDELDLLEVA